MYIPIISILMMIIPMEALAVYPITVLGPSKRSLLNKYPLVSIDSQPLDSLKDMRIKQIGI